MENIYMLLFQFVGNFCQLCNVGWLATQESVFLVPHHFGAVVGAARPRGALWASRRDGAVAEPCSRRWRT